MEEKKKLTLIVATSAAVGFGLNWLGGKVLDKVDEDLGCPTDVAWQCGKDVVVYGYQSAEQLAKSLPDFPAPQPAAREQFATLPSTPWELPSSTTSTTTTTAGGNSRVYVGSVSAT